MTLGLSSVPRLRAESREFPPDQRARGLVSPSFNASMPKIQTALIYTKRRTAYIRKSYGSRKEIDGNALCHIGCRDIINCEFVTLLTVSNFPRRRKYRSVSFPRISGLSLVSGRLHQYRALAKITVTPQTFFFVGRYTQ